jgi:CheY-like chemotaxis protein
MEKKTILIAASNIGAWSELSNYLSVYKDNFFHYREARDGETALRSIRTGVADMVLLDLEQPVTDGIEILRQVRKAPDENTRKIVIIVVTSLNDKTVVQKVLQLGVEGYIVKPYDINDIVAKIKELMEKDSIKEIMDNVFKPILIELFGKKMGLQILAQAVTSGKNISSQSDKLSHIITSIYKDQRFVGMLGTAGARKVKDKWDTLVH